VSNLNTETMVIKQYELRSGAGQVTFPDAGVIEVITFNLQDGAEFVRSADSSRT